MDIRSFVDSQIVASNRSRNVLLILSTASILAFVGFWNSKPVSWMNSRIEVLSRDLEYLKGRKLIIDQEQALAKLKAKCGDEEKARQSSTPAPTPIPSSRGPTRFPVMPMRWHAVQVWMNTFWPRSLSAWAASQLCRRAGRLRVHVFAGRRERL